MYLYIVIGAFDKAEAAERPRRQLSLTTKKVERENVIIRVSNFAYRVDSRSKQFFDSRAQPLFHGETCLLRRHSSLTSKKVQLECGIEPREPDHTYFGL